MRNFRLVSSLILVAALAIAAAFLRLEKLAEKPLHTDEAVQSYKVAQLLDGTGYRYDPADHHGPVMYYLAAAACKISGQKNFAEMTIFPLRAITALFGIALVFSTGLWRLNGIKRPVLFVAATLAALSPVAVYYARYFIQETIFVFCFWAAVPLLWRIFHEKNDTAGKKFLLSIAAGILLGLTVALKETWILFAAASGVITLVLAGKSFFNSTLFPAIFQNFRQIFCMIGVTLLVAILFYSSFGKNPGGVIDALSAFGGYFEKSSGSPHDKPFGWYFENFFLPVSIGKFHFPMEIFTTIGVIFALIFLVAQRKKKSAENKISASALAIGVILFLLYSMLGYKTPWLILCVLPPLWLAAAFGYCSLCETLQRAKIPLWISTGAIVLTVSFFAKNSRVLATRLAADERNPLAYVHTTPDVFRIEKIAAEIAAVPLEKKFRIEVHAHEYWPLPWHFRRWEASFFPPEPDDEMTPIDAAMVISTPENDTAISARLQGEYRADLFGLRPNVFLILRVRQDALDEISKNDSPKKNE